MMSETVFLIRLHNLNFLSTCASKFLSSTIANAFEVDAN